MLGKLQERANDVIEGARRHMLVERELRPNSPLVGNRQSQRPLHMGLSNRTVGRAAL